MDKLANSLLKTLLNNSGCYQAPTTLDLWKHIWRPSLFDLIVDDFGIYYVGKRHLHHLRTGLKEHNEITEDLLGSKFSGIKFQWDYIKRTYQLALKGYIRKLLIVFCHPIPDKPQLSPHKHVQIQYRSVIQYIQEPANIPK